MQGGTRCRGPNLLCPTAEASHTLVHMSRLISCTEHMTDREPAAASEDVFVCVTRVRCASAMDSVVLRRRREMSRWRVARPHTVDRDHRFAADEPPTDATASASPAFFVPIQPLLLESRNTDSPLGFAPIKVCSVVPQRTIKRHCRAASAQAWTDPAVLAVCLQ